MNNYTFPNIVDETDWIFYSAVHDIPHELLHTEFDWVNEPENAVFIRHGDVWFSIDEFMKIDDASPLKLELGWHAIYHDNTFNSGYLLMLSESSISYKLARFFGTSDKTIKHKQ